MKSAFVAACILLVASGLRKTKGSAIDAVTSPVVEAKCGASLDDARDKTEERLQRSLLSVTWAMHFRIMAGLYHHWTHEAT